MNLKESLNFISHDIKRYKTTGGFIKNLKL